MKKLMKIIGLILPLMGGLHAAETSIIPGASYYVAHPTDDQSNPNVIIFRDYQGRDLKEDKEVWKSRLHMDMQLDANALKPQPVDCEVAWWEARPIGNGHTIGTSGYYAYFKDSQGDIAKIMRFDLEKNLFLEIVKSPQSASGIKMIYRKLNELETIDLSNFSKEGRYNILEASLLDRIYNKQKSLISDHKQYENIMKPILQSDDAKKLAILNYCKDNPDSDIAQNVVRTFVVYNVDIFLNMYANGSLNDLEKSRQLLQGILVEIKKESSSLSFL